jgi:hypothetical protein
MLLSRRVAEPTFESGLGKAGVISGEEGALDQFCAVVGRVWIRRKLGDTQATHR